MNIKVFELFNLTYFHSIVRKPFFKIPQQITKKRVITKKDKSKKYVFFFLYKIVLLKEMLEMTSSFKMIEENTNERRSASIEMRRLYIMAI